MIASIFMVTKSRDESKLLCVKIENITTQAQNFGSVINKLSRNIFNSVWNLNQNSQYNI